MVHFSLSQKDFARSWQKNRDRSHNEESWEGKGDEMLQILEGVVYTLGQKGLVRRKKHSKGEGG